MKFRQLIVVATALLVAPAVVGQTTFTVTVAPKSAAHPLFGQGHPDAFVIDGIEANALTLIRGETYIFQMDNTPGFHPFYISTDDTGAGLGEWTDGVTGSGAAGTDALTFVVSSGAPDELFYQCFNHQFMGWELNVVDPVDVTCTPMNPPIVIPAGGGLYLFDLQIVNYTASSAIFDIWLNVDGPGGGVERGPVTKLLAPGDTLFRTLAQNMPASQPAGAYTQTCSVGTHPIADDCAPPGASARARNPHPRYAPGRACLSRIRSR